MDKEKVMQRLKHFLFNINGLTKKEAIEILEEYILIIKEMK